MKTKEIRTIHSAHDLAAAVIPTLDLLADAVEDLTADDPALKAFWADAVARAREIVTLSRSG